MDEIIQRAVLIGQAIEDLTFDALSSPRIGVEIAGVRSVPQYKSGGYFIFSDLWPGVYTLRIFGERFQTQEHRVEVPVDPFVLDSPPTVDLAPLIEMPGDNELVVVAKSINGGENKIVINPLILRKEIKKGSRVIATDFSGRLAGDLAVGRITQVRLNHVTGLTPQSIIRIVRERSFRLKFDPYYLFPMEVTSIVGRVVLDSTRSDGARGVEVRLTRIDGTDVHLNEIGGAEIASFDLAGNASVLGSEKDIIALTNEKGDYILYFRPGQLAGSVVLRAYFPGYQMQTQTVAITESTRNRADFYLFRT